MDLHLLRQLANDWPASAVVRTFPVASPAAGADWSFTAPGESILGLVAVSARLVTSAVVANRAPVLSMGDGSTTFYRVAPDVVQAASLTTDYSWLPELAANDTAVIGAVQNIAMPPTFMMAGWKLAPATLAIDVGDQWSNVVILAMEVFHGEREQERTIANALVERADAIADLLGGQI